MYALGDLFDLATGPANAAKWVSVKDCATVTLVAIGATAATNATVSIATDAAGTGSVTYAPANGFDGIATYWAWTTATGLWTKGTNAPAVATFPTTATAGDIAVAEINMSQLDNGLTPAGTKYAYISAIHATAQILVIRGRLAAMRRPSNLRSATV